MSLERLLSLLGTSVPDLDADELADALYLAVHLREPVANDSSSPEIPEPIVPAATDSQSPEIPAPKVPAPAQQNLQPQPEKATSSSPDRPPSQPVTPLHPAPPSPPAASLYSGPQMIDVQEGLLFRTPQAPPLPGWNELARAFRPLHIRVPSHHNQRLDIPTTVRQIAESRIWLPVLRPLAEPRFEVVLVMDDTPAMAIWQSMVYELAQLLQRHSALRKLRSYRLRFDHTGQALLVPGLVRNVGETPHAAASQLRDPSGRTLILIASDAVGQHWRDGRMAQVITTWTEHSLVSLIQVLPTSYWDRSALGVWPAARADAGSPGVPNRRLPYVARRGRLGRPTPSGVPVPVLNLDPVALTTWARLVAGTPAASTPAYLILATAVKPTPVAAPDPDTIVNTFLGSASPVAQHLAGLLAAAAPLSLPVARLVQSALLPESRQMHLAEVWLSGLLHPIDALATNQTDPDDLIYEFHLGVRERLYPLVPATESLAVLRAVSGYIGARIGQPRDFRAWVQSDEALDADDPRRRFATVAASVLYAMGGAYRDLAERLDRAGHEQPPYRPLPISPSLEEGADSAPPLEEGINSTRPLEEGDDWWEGADSVPPQGDKADDASLPPQAARTDPAPQRRVRADPARRWGAVRIGEVWVPELIHIPAGPFLMGSSDNDLYADNDEKPQHRLTLPDYWIGKTPITNAQFRPFVEGDGYRNQQYWTENGWKWREESDLVKPLYWSIKRTNDSDHAVIGVSWYEAVAYCHWLTAQTGHKFRLPSEAEWEKAARGPDGLIWPWGNNWEEGRCNTVGPSTTPVGQYPNGASPYGVLDMAGNVWEWMTTEWGKGYPYQLEDEWGAAYLEMDTARSVRGGSYWNGAAGVRGAYRLISDPRHRSLVQGLRVASYSPLPDSASRILSSVSGIAKFFLGGRQRM